MLVKTSGSVSSVFQYCCSGRDPGVLMFSKSDLPLKMFVFDTEQTQELPLTSAAGLTEGQFEV